MRKIFTILIVCISEFMFAQTNDSFGSWIIKANATALVDITTFPTIQFSAEKKFAKHFSVSVETGLQVYDFHQVDTAFLKPKGFRLNMETRWYLSTFFHPERSSNRVALYVGFQPYFRKNQFNANIRYYSKPDSATIRSDNLGIKNTTYGFNCLIGIQKSISRRMIIELYAGLGYKQRTISNTDRQVEYDEGTSLAGMDMGPYFQSLNLRESSGSDVNFTLGLRFGYKL